MSLDAENDAALLERLVRTRDARAFETLYRRHSERLFATAFRIAGDADVAADVLHDAWVRAVENGDRFERRSEFRTWLTGIVINCARERRRQDARDGDADPLDHVARAEPPLDATDVDPIDLDAAIAALPPRFREVLVLHDVEGFTHEEIAELLGVVPGTSKSQLTRARRRVREMLESGVRRAGRGE